MLLDRFFLYVSKNPPTRPTKYKNSRSREVPAKTVWKRGGLAVGRGRSALCAPGFPGRVSPCTIYYEDTARRRLGSSGAWELGGLEGGSGRFRPVPYTIRTRREAVGAGAGSGGGAVQSANQPIQLISRRSVGAPTALRSHFPRARLGLCSMSSMYYKVQGAGRGRGRGGCDGAWWIFMRDRLC